MKKTVLLMLAMFFIVLSIAYALFDSDIYPTTIVIRTNITIDENATYVDTNFTAGANITIIENVISVASGLFTNLKNTFDTLYQPIGSYVTHLFLDANYYNKTQVNALCNNGSGGQANLNSTNYLGSNLTGSNGDANRQLTVDADLVAVDNFFLIPTTDYTNSGGVITFLNPIWDDQRITVWDSGLTNVNYLGSDCTGSSGNTNRVLTASNAELVAVDRFFIQPTYDYTANSTHIKFLNPIWDSQIITVWR